MPKVKVYSVDPREKYRITGELFEVIANLRTKKEVIEFLIGLLTPSETLMVARRVQIAKMLLEGENDFEFIRKRMKVSNQTIVKVEHWLRGDENKNALIVKKIKEIKRSRRFSGGTGSLLDKYAQHRILRDLF